MSENDAELPLLDRSMTGLRLNGFVGSAGEL